ncbi:MAG: type I 3-dehydroquinate dehydratase [Deltaproteobacteria bacterium]|nr:type I 3-dehydroquinate dehydratase [Deltaproteobacteria bacterium]
MSPLLRGRARRRICLPIVETTTERAIQAIHEAHPLADLLELRLDYLRNPALKRLSSGRKKPFIITNRRKEEGGRYRGSESRRLEVFEEAIDLGMDFIDVELETQRSLLYRLINNKGETKVILSFHDFTGTPSQQELKTICDRMFERGGDIAKIVTFAKSYEDNLNILSLLPYARRRNLKIVTFCMGEKGRMSRIFAPMMGAAWTYGCLSRTRASAPGQLTPAEMKEFWRRLR